MRKISAMAAVLGLASVASASVPGLASSGTSTAVRDNGFNNAVADFMWDDGTAETSVGVNNGMTGTTFGWANRFVNNTGAAINLQSIEIAFGRAMGTSGALAVGNAVDGVIWIDAAATGTLNNATVARRWSLPGGVHAINGTLATHTIPMGGVNVPAGAQFYVGAGDIQTEDDMLIRFPASIDQTDPDVPGVSWAFFGPAVFNPIPAANTQVGTIEALGGPGLAGNWLVRANIPEPATIGLLAIGGLALLRRRR